LLSLRGPNESAPGPTSSPSKEKPGKNKKQKNKNKKREGQRERERRRFFYIPGLATRVDDQNGVKHAPPLALFQELPVFGRLRRIYVEEGGARGVVVWQISGHDKLSGTQGAFEERECFFFTFFFFFSFFLESHQQEAIVVCGGCCRTSCRTSSLCDRICAAGKRGLGEVFEFFSSLCCSARESTNRFIIRRLRNVATT
jgi:hypothetical protein